MLKVVIVDSSAESRNSLVKQISNYLHPARKETEFLPRMSIRPLSPQEIRFHESPDICIVGKELVRSDLTELGRIKKVFSESAILVEISEDLESIAVIEQLARYGADDIIAQDISAQDFIRKVILLSRRKGKSRSGKLLLVDSGKGGVGATSVASGLAEVLVDTGKRVAVLDLDVETQDLSRFLQARPFLNENLQAIFESARPITQEFVDECTVKVWENDDRFVCIPPIPNADSLFDPRLPNGRMLVSVLEVLDASYDCIVVDLASARSSILRTLYRVADAVIFVVNNDPATLYASVERLGQLRPNLAPEAEVLVIENSTASFGLPSSVLRREFSRAAKITENEWIDKKIPLCKTGYKWPGSGGTLYSQGNERVRAAIKKIVCKLGIVEEKNQGLLHSALDFSKKLRKFDRFRAYSSEDIPRQIPSSFPGAQKLLLSTDHDLVAGFNESLEPINHKEINCPGTSEEVSDSSNLITSARLS